METTKSLSIGDVVYVHDKTGIIVELYTKFNECMIEFRYSPNNNHCYLSRESCDDVTLLLSPM